MKKIYYIRAEEMPPLDTKTKKWLYENTEMGKKSKDYHDFNSRLWNKLFIRTDGGLFVRDINFATYVMKVQEKQMLEPEDVSEFKKLAKRIMSKIKSIEKGESVLGKGKTKEEYKQECEEEYEEEYKDLTVTDNEKMQENKEDEYNYDEQDIWSPKVF